MTARLANAGAGAHATTPATTRVAARPTVRRILVTIGVVLSLITAGATIRAASLWAASHAPLTVAPVSIDSVQMALAQEKSRSVVLEEQIASLEQSAIELNAALGAARDRLVTDQATADELRASLAAAQDKLTTLEASLAAAQARTQTRTTTRSSGEIEDEGIDD